MVDSPAPMICAKCDTLPESACRFQTITLGAAGVPVGVTLMSILSPAVTVTPAPVQVPVVAEPEMVRVRAVSAAFLRTVNTYCAAPPGAVPTET